MNQNQISKYPSLRAAAQAPRTQQTWPLPRPSLGSMEKLVRDARAILAARHANLSISKADTIAALEALLGDGAVDSEPLTDDEIMGMFHDVCESGEWPKAGTRTNILAFARALIAGSAP